MDKISIGIIGSGVFGRYHALKCIARDDLRFVGIFANDKIQAKALVKEVGGQVFSGPDQLFSACDAVIIACPATFHAEYAIQGLEKGCHLLIEKPLATTISDAQHILKGAKQFGKTVQVGHQERFVLRAIGFDKIDQTPIRIHGRRLSPFSVRGTDTTVTMDLMSHDIDLANWLMKGLPDKVSGDAIIVRSEKADAALGILDYSNGRVILEASRVEDAGSRQMIISYREGNVTIDFNAKTLSNNTPFSLNENFGDHPEVKDSLAAGLNEFVSAIRENREPLISGTDGRRVVEIACTIDGTT